jgi:hypothetical protein
MSLPPTGRKDIGLASVPRAELEIPWFGPRILSAPIKSFMVSALLRALIGADFLLAPRIKRLFYGFSPF